MSPITPFRNLADKALLAVFALFAYPGFRLMDLLERRGKRKAKDDLYHRALKLQEAQAARAEDLRKAMARRRAEADPAIRAARILEFREARADRSQV